MFLCFISYHGARRVGFHSVVDTQGYSFFSPSFFSCVFSLCSHVVLHYVCGGGLCLSRSLLSSFTYFVPVLYMSWSGAEPADGFCTTSPFHYRTKLAAYALSVRVLSLTELVNFPGVRAISSIISVDPDLFQLFFVWGWFEMMIVYHSCTKCMGTSRQAASSEVFLGGE